MNRSGLTGDHRKEWTVILFALLSSLGWTALAGKDMSWDVINHHYYIPFAWINDRVLVDFYGAGPQSYQNPLGYIPFYLAINANLPDWAVGGILSILHAPNAYLIWLIARRLWPADSHWPLASAALAYLSPSYLQVAGTSSIDPIACTLVLVAIWQLLSLESSSASSLLGGFALGLAFAIKPTQAVFVLACAAMTGWQFLSGRRNFSALLVFASGSLLGLVAGLGWQASVLWKEFSSPFFPLFNNIFHSPLAPAGSTVMDRFIPATLLDALLRPLEMASVSMFAYQEASAPDLRPLAAFGALAALVSAKLFRMLRSSFRDQTTPPKWSPADSDLTVVSITAYVAWLASSGNGRYALALMLLFGLLLVRWAWLALPPSAARVTLALVACLHIAHFANGGMTRINAAPWSGGPYYAVQASKRLLESPALHLSINTQSAGSIAAFLAPDGALINVIGQMSLPVDGPAGDELKKRMEVWHSRIRVLYSAPDDTIDAKTFRALLESMLWRFEVRVDWNDCESIYLGQPTGHGAELMINARSKRRELHSCRLEAGTPHPEHVLLAHELEIVDRAFARIEEECPKLFTPIPLSTDRGLQAWQRTYSSSDVYVIASITDGVLATHSRSLQGRHLGSVQDVASGRAQVSCAPLPRNNSF